MTTLQRITAILEQARIAGGWIDEDVALVLLSELGLDEHGKPIDVAPTSPNLGRG